MIILIFAMTRYYVIGYNEHLPWKIKEELQLFRYFTIKNTILMGRKTFQGIGKLLPNRVNLILTKNKKTWLKSNFPKKQQETQNNWKIIDDLKSCLTTFSQKKLFIIGGANVFQQTFPYADYLYVSIIKKPYFGNVYFPVTNWSTFHLISTFWFNEFKTFIYKKENFFKVQ